MVSFKCCSPARLQKVFAFIFIFLLSISIFLCICIFHCTNEGFFFVSHFTVVKNISKIIYSNELNSRGLGST